jgi:hypothetical protein
VQLNRSLQREALPDSVCAPAPWHAAGAAHASSSRAAARGSVANGVVMSCGLPP